MPTVWIDPTCVADGCAEPRKRNSKRRLCKTHNALCGVDGCENARHRQRTFCSLHAARLDRHGDVNFTTPQRRADVSIRFWSKVNVRGPRDCWLYQGTVLSNGYGQFFLQGHDRVSAHRFAYVDRVGSIPGGLAIDHLCNVRQCVNPCHLEPVTDAENMRRRFERERVAALALTAVEVAS